MSVVHQHQVGRRVSPSFRHAGVVVKRLSLVDRVERVGLLGHLADKVALKLVCYL